MDEAYEGSCVDSQLVVHDKLAHRQLLHELMHRLIDHKTSTFPEAYLSKINPIANANFVFLRYEILETFNVSLRNRSVLFKM